MSWSALVIVGDGNGHVGVGLGKARAIPDAIRKGVEAAKKNIIEVPIVDGTLPHETFYKLGAARIMLKPASAGTGIVAGSSMRTILELAGVHDVLGKSLGSNNSLNVAWATISALQSLKRVETVASRRGTTPEALTPWIRKTEEKAHAG
jgi:small subunit ribosomal protein S5